MYVDPRSEPPAHTRGLHDPLRNNVIATSTLLRSACLIDGQVFAQRTSVFRE